MIVFICPQCGATIPEREFDSQIFNNGCPKCGTRLGNFGKHEISDTVVIHNGHKMNTVNEIIRR